MKPGSRGPAAIPYTSMPGYRAAAEMARELLVVARRVGPDGEALEPVLHEKSLQTLLMTSEAGARADTMRRRLLYRYAWMGTVYCDSALGGAIDRRRAPPESLMGAHTLVRMAQQALITVGGAILVRLEAERGARGGRGDQAEQAES